MTNRLALARRAGFLALGLVAAVMLAAGCGSGHDTAAALGVRIDQVPARDIAVTVTNTTARITWVTRDSQLSTVRYGTTSGLGLVARGTVATTQHSLDLTGLTADTIYFYVVSASDTVYRFRTMGGQRQRIAFTSDRSDGRREVYLAYEWGENVTRLTTAGGESPALSRDGTRIAWAGPGAGGTKDIWAATLNTNGLVAGSQVNLTNTADRDETQPDWSPDNTKIVFLASSAADGTRILARTIAANTEQVIVPAPGAHSSPKWRPDGTQIAFSSTTRTATVQLGRRPIDAGSLQVTLNNAAHTPVLSNQVVVFDGANGWVDFSGSTATGQNVLVSYTSNGAAVNNVGVSVPRAHPEIWSVASGGGSLRRLTDSSEYSARTAPCWHPTQALLVFVGENGVSTNLLSVNDVGSALVNVTNGGYADRDPVISPDGATVLLSTNRNPYRLIDLWRSDYAGNMVELNIFSSADTQPSWSVVP